MDSFLSKHTKESALTDSLSIDWITSQLAALPASNVVEVAVYSDLSGFIVGKAS
jgi:hypothetical protein